MCGIVGLYLKTPKYQAQLGELFEPMLVEMTARGPDSAGVAIYRNPVKDNEVKLSLAHDDAAFNLSLAGPTVHHFADIVSRYDFLYSSIFIEDTHIDGIAIGDIVDADIDQPHAALKARAVAL